MVVSFLCTWLLSGKKIYCRLEFVIIIEIVLGCFSFFLVLTRELCNVEHGLDSYPHTFSSSGVSSATSSSSSIDRASTGSASSSSGAVSRPDLISSTSYISIVQSHRLQVYSSVYTVTDYKYRVQFRQLMVTHMCT